MNVIQIQPDNPPKGWKKKMCYFAWNGDELMIPAAGIGMGDQEALLCCSYDGAPIVETNGAILVSETWARKEKPLFSEVIDRMKEQATKFKDER